MKVMLRNNEAGKLEVYVAKKDLEEERQVTFMESSRFSQENGN